MKTLYVAPMLVPIILKTNAFRKIQEIFSLPAFTFPLSCLVSYVKYVSLENSTVRG